MFEFGHVSLKQIITVSFTLFAVIDMLGSAPILISLKAKMGGKIGVWQATLASGLLMILFLFLGREFLNVLGLDIKSFAVAGSIVIFILDWKWCSDLNSLRPTHREERKCCTHCVSADRGKRNTYHDHVR